MLRRRSPRLLAKRRKKEALEELRSDQRKRVTNEKRNSSHRANSTAANLHQSTTGNVGRSPQSSRSGGVGLDISSKASSDGFRSFHSNVSESPRQVIVSRGRDRKGESKVDMIGAGSTKPRNNKRNRIIEETSTESGDDIKDSDLFITDRTAALFDNDFSKIINGYIFRQALMNDVITAAIILIINDKINESTIYTLPKPIQTDIINKQYIMKNGLLYYIPKNAYIVPPKLRDPLLQYFHRSITTLHQGVQRMYKLMQTRVYWKGMQTDIRQYVSNCTTCSISKATPNQREGYMQLFSVHKPFEIVHMDVVGPLPITKNGNIYILTIMDRFSRMVKLIPLPTVDAACIATAFRNNWLLQFGVPDKTLTDRGSYFTGLIFAILSKMFGFKCLFTTSYHPRTNGRLERFHRFLKQRLRILAYDRSLDFFDSDDWDIFIPNIAFSYNITPNRMNGYSPYQVLYDDWIKLPIDRILNTDFDTVVNEEKEAYKNPMDARLRPIKINAKHRDFIREARKRRQHLIKEIQDKEAKYDTKRKADYDAQRLPASNYNPGDTVFIDVSVGKVGNKKKLGINRKRGTIIDQIGDNVYTIQYDNGKIEPVNVDRLYTVSKTKNKSISSQPPKPGKNRHRNYKRRNKKRKIKSSNSNKYSPPNKRQRQ